MYGKEEQHGNPKGKMPPGGPGHRYEYYVNMCERNGVGGCVLDLCGLRLGANCGFLLSLRVLKYPVNLTGR